MLPLLACGDEVLVDQKAYRNQSPRAGDIVIARHPTKADVLMIKRVKEVRQNSLCHLDGDNPDPARNSPSVVSFGQIMGRVTCRFAPAP